MQLLVVVTTLALLWARCTYAEEPTKPQRAQGNAAPASDAVQQKQTPTPVAQSLTAAPQLPSFAHYQPSPLHFNYLASPTTDLFGASQNDFRVNQPLVASDLSSLTQATPTPFAGLVDTKYLEQAGFHFKSSPLVDTQVYHPRVTELQATPRFSSYLNPAQFTLKLPEPQTATLEVPQAPPTPANQITYRGARVLHRPAERSNQQPDTQQNSRQNTLQNIQQNSRPNIQLNFRQNPPQNAQQNTLQHVQPNFPQNLQHNVQRNFQQNMQQLLQQNLQQNRQPQRYYIRRKPQQQILLQQQPPQQINVLAQQQPNIYNTLPNRNLYNIQAKQPQPLNEQRSPVPLHQMQLNQFAPNQMLGQQRHVSVPADNAGPPTPPRYYSNFKPMLPKDIPVKEDQTDEQPADRLTQKEKQRMEDEEQRKEEEKEESEEVSNEKQEESEEEEEEEPVKPKYRHRGSEEDDRDLYKRGRNDDDDEEYEENRGYTSYADSPVDYSKLFSKHRYPKEYKFVPTYLKQHKSNLDCDYTDALRRKGDDPDVHVKTYKYVKSVSQPDVNESIEGKESETIPVVLHRKKSYKEHWLITKSTQSAD